MPRRVVAYIDGFNLYHSIDRYLGDDYKWVDYRKMVENFLWVDDHLENVFLFTADPKWKKDKTKHTLFMRIQALKNGVRIINGNYSEVTRHFSGNKMKIVDPQDKSTLHGVNVQPSDFYYATFEEKQTDVNIALYVLEGAFNDYYDKAIIFSWDSDIAPAIIMAKKHFPEKFFQAILPINWKWHAMARACDKTKPLKASVLDVCKIWDTNVLPSGEVIHNPYKTNIPPSGDIQGWGWLIGCDDTIA